MVEQPSRSGDQNVDAAGQFGVLIAERNAADQKRHGKLVVCAVFLKVLGDLGCEFTGRRQNERARHARPRPSLREALDHRQGKRRGLAGAGLGDAKHVAPF